MGKKFTGVNTKVQQANERKEKAKNEKKKKENDAIEKAMEKEWENGKNIRSEKRKMEEERKKEEMARKQAEKKRLEALENENVKNIRIDRSATRKTKEEKASDREWAKKIPITKPMKEKPIIREKKVMMMNEIPIIEKGMKGIVFDDKLEIENLNREYEEGTAATTIDEAINVLNDGGKQGTTGDLHPEKRMKALYKEYETKMLPIMKEEYPKLKLSQYKERIFESWKKAPENPLNQVNTKR